ncbi:MAG: hypothetical protein KAS32_09520 [Candidatus Peribacteraceae bacterium]|nr:hypothetical protein [Candidatus Peribacteraceae bacterium]
MRYVDKEVNRRNKRAEVNVHDLLISIKGTLGEVAVAEEWLLPANMNRDVAILKPLQENDISPYLLSSFLMSKYGAIQSKRVGSGGVQQMITLERLRKLLIPEFSKEFNKNIEDVYLKSLNFKNKSKNIFKEAEQLLLTELEFDKFVPSQEPVNIKSLKDSFGSSGRLDAEYYQKKYDEIHLKIRSKEFFVLKNEFNILTNPSPSYYDKSGIKVIKTKDVRIPSIDFEGITDHTNLEGLRVKSKDLLFASMGVGSLGRVGYVHEIEYESTIDGTIKILRSKKNKLENFMEIPALLFLTSKLGQDIIYKYIIGSTGIISISKENIENLEIPVFNIESRKILTKMVLDSIKYRRESELLLEIAKLGVEMAIEQDEQTAMSMIYERIKNEVENK